MSDVGLFRVAVEAVVLKENKILITKRSPNRDHAPNEWEIITGRMKNGETFEQAVKREVKEEVNLEIRVLRPFNTFHFYRGPNKEEHLGVSFLCEYVSGKVKLDINEQVDYKWVITKEALKFIKNKNILSSIEKLIEMGI